MRLLHTSSLHYGGTRIYLLYLQLFHFVDLVCDCRPQLTYACFLCLPPTVLFHNAFNVESTACWESLFPAHAPCRTFWSSPATIWSPESVTLNELKSETALSTFCIIWHFCQASIYKHLGALAMFFIMKHFVSSAAEEAGVAPRSARSCASAAIFAGAAGGT